MAQSLIATDVVTSVADEPFALHVVRTGVHSRDRERWLRIRRHGLGGSEVAAILGVHPYKSALEVYADKVGTPPANDVAEAALWGQLLEAPIREEFARRTGRRVLEGGELLRSRSRSHWQVTLDGIQLEGAPTIPRWAVGPGPLEIKTVAYYDQIPWHERIPAHVQIQLQHQLLVTGAVWGTVGWLPLPERQLGWIDMPAHAEFQAYLSERCDAFWARVLERREPDPDGSDSAARALCALHPELDDRCIELDDEAEAVADEVEHLSQCIKAFEQRKTLIHQRVMATLGDESVALLPSGRYFSSWVVADRQVQCAHCQAVTGTVRGFRAARLFGPRKKPHGVPIERRSLAISAPEPELAALLEASLAEARR